MTMKLLEKIRDKVSCHVAGLPVPYRTTEKEPGFLNISDDGCNCIPVSYTHLTLPTNREV